MRKILAVALLASNPVAAQEVKSLFTGNGYLAACTDENPVSRAVCIQYTLGMDETLLVLNLSGITKALECSPDSTTGRQKKDILVKFLQDNPEVRHMPTAQIYLAAMAAAFPCSKQHSMAPADKRM